MKAFVSFPRVELFIIVDIYIYIYIYIFFYFILSDNCSTCFGRYYNPSSGAQTTVTTASGNRYTVLLSVAIVEELELI